MATYKVIQDIEAEDKLLGPLTLKQFIYATIAVVGLYICFLLITKHMAFLLVLFLPVALLAGFFAWPWSREQPTEIWALAKIRFLLKPRQRIWDQSGVKELVTITAPKKVETHFSNNFTQTEVKSRLKTLADTIDSRGWAVKNVDLNLYSQPATLAATGTDSDRLIDPSSLPSVVSNVDIRADDDIMDETSNPIAHQFDQMIHASDQTHRQQIMQQLHDAASVQMKTSSKPIIPPAATQTNVPTSNIMFSTQMVAPGTDDQDLPVVPGMPTPAEAALGAQLKAEAQKPDVSYAHLRTIQPLAGQVPGANPQPSTAKMVPGAQKTTARAPDPAILDLANNNDLNVATLARQAHQSKDSEPPEGEVIVPLH